MISVIVVNHNGGKYLAACLLSIVRQKGVSKEIIVVDDASTDSSPALFKKFPAIKLLRLKTNLGPAAARNRGVKISRGEILLFLDVDTRLAAGALGKIETEMIEDKTVGAGQLDLIDHYGHFLSACGLPYQAKREQREIFGGISAALAVKRPVFEKIGGFDEDYFIYGEDTDLCWRIWLAGYRVKKLTAKAKHFGKSSLSKKDRLYYYGARNSLTSIIKNADKNLVIFMAFSNAFFWLGVSLLKLTLAPLIGWLAGLAALPKTLEKRRQIIRTGASQCRKIVFGKIAFRQLIQKAYRWLKND